MSRFGEWGDVTVDLDDDYVATAEIHRPPDNFFDIALIDALADAFEALDADPGCRAIVMCSEGKHFCAGAQFTATDSGISSSTQEGGSRRLYTEAVRLFRAATPVVTAVQGAAVGGGLGLALVGDFRVAAPEARFSANFARLGFHHGFGTTVTLPLVVGHQKALEMLYTGQRVKGEEAVAMGLADRLAPLDRVRDEAHALAAEIAQSAPLAVTSIRATMRGHLADEIKAATDHELDEQDRLRGTDDWSEGVRAMAERRAPQFTGR